MTNRAPSLPCFLPLLSCAVLLLSCPLTVTAESPAASRNATPTSQVRIASSTQPAGSSSIEIGSNSWIARGYDLKSLLSQVYEIDPRRIDLPEGSLASKRFDVTLVLPHEEDSEAMLQQIKQALANKLGLSIQPVLRPVDVYLLTAPKGPGPALRRSNLAHLASFGHGSPTGPLGGEGFGRFTYQGQSCPGVSAGGISASSGTIAEFRRTLEPTLDRPLVDETNLNAAYDFQIAGFANQQELFHLLHDQLGILVTPTTRTVPVLAVRPLVSAEERLSLL